LGWGGRTAGLPGAGVHESRGARVPRTGAVRVADFRADLRFRAA
jgi:hypothetical protein